MRDPSSEIVESLIQIAQRCWQRGWTRAGSCCYSRVDSAQPKRIWITTSARCRSQLSLADFAQRDLENSIQSSHPTEPATASNTLDQELHCWVASKQSVEGKPLAIIQTQSVWPGLLADRFASLDGVIFEEHRLLQQLGFDRCPNSIWLPIAMYEGQPSKQISQIEKAMQFTPSDCQLASAVVIQNHCLLTWADDLETAFRRAEVLEYFCEYLVRRAAIS